LEDEPEQVIPTHYVVPEVVKQFVTYFYRHIKDRNVYDIYSMYENTFNKITEKYFKNSPWPPAESIASLVHNDTLFLVLYKELYFRHIYSKMQPTLEQRFDSWKNYCELFNLVLQSNELNLELPNQWIWDIIDEFIYQFQGFCQYRAKIKTKTQEELTLLANNTTVWNVKHVIQYLDSLVSKSQIVQLLQKEKSGESVENVTGNTSGVYKMLGYFSLIGLLRVHTLLGDYYLALKSVSGLELTTKGLFTKVSACHITLYYYLGFVYLMTRRYVDAIKTFANVLLYVTRTKQYHTRSVKYDSIMKKSEQMYGLLAICIALCPQRVDENVHTALREKYGDKMQKMQKGDLATFDEVFQFACPKFIAAFVPISVDEKAPIVNYYQEPMQLQTKLFLNEVAEQSLVPTIRSYLKLYTTISTQKLANFLEIDEKTFRTQLMCYKHKTRGLVNTGNGSVELVSYSDVDFAMDKNMLHISDSKIARRYSEFFVRHTDKLLHLLQDKQ